MTEDSEERDNSSNIPSFGFHNETNSKKTNFYSLDKFQSKKEKHSYDNLQDQEPMYSDPIEPTKGDRWKEPQKGAPKPRSRSKQHFIVHENSITFNSYFKVSPKINIVIQRMKHRGILSALLIWHIFIYMS